MAVTVREVYLRAPPPKRPPLCLFTAKPGIKLKDCGAFFGHVAGNLRILPGVIERRLRWGG